MPKIAAPVAEVLGQPRRPREGGPTAGGAGEPRPGRRGGRRTRPGGRRRKPICAAPQRRAVPESVVKAQTDVEADQEQHGCRQKGARQPRRSCSSKARWRASWWMKPRWLTRRPRASSKPPRSICGRSKRRASRSRSRPPPRRWKPPRRNSQTAQAQLSYSEIRSPIAGVIADRPLYAGEMASAGTPLLTVMDISRVVARVNIPAGPGRPA